MPAKIKNNIFKCTKRKTHSYQAFDRACYNQMLTVQTVHRSKMKKRYRQLMYTQDLKHLPFKLSELKNILQKEPLDEWAYILHNKDVNKNQKHVRDHLHLILKYSNPQSIDHVAKIFDDQNQYIEIWNGRINNAYSYLIHATNDAKNKYQYSPKEVIASFDFEKKIKEIQTHISSKKVNIEKVLNDYAIGILSYSELVKKIGILNVAKNQRLINTIEEIRNEERQKIWLKEFQNKQMVTLWLWGGAGVGKTTYAKHILKDEKYVVLGSSNDYFQNYHGEHYIIINDLRPEDFKYADLLRILDPYEHNKSAPSRYHDKNLRVEMIIITTPYSPYQFYKNTHIYNRKIDTFKQLQRRLFSIHITSNFIKQEEKYGKIIEQN